jgi:hypothetical protein
MQPNPELFLCEGCEIRHLEPEQRLPALAVMHAAIRQWWYGDASPDRYLHDIVYDEMRYDHPSLSNLEKDTIYACAAEHSSLRCESLSEARDSSVLNNLEIP